MCPSTDEWIDRVRRYYSAIKKNEIMPFSAMWIDLEIVMWSELSESKTNII